MVKGAQPWAPQEQLQEDSCQFMPRLSYVIPMRQFWKELPDT